MNKVLLMGRLVKDPETRQAGETTVTRFSIAVDRRFKTEGIRFIKNDYNQNVGIGIDGACGEASPEELKRNQAAFMALIDRVCKAFPDLVVENCSSGCMRADHASETHFYMQSVSDQEYYERMPSVVQGLFACMPPERVGIWGYPYPNENLYQVVGFCLNKAIEQQFTVNYHSVSFRFVYMSTDLKVAVLYQNRSIGSMPSFKMNDMLTNLKAICRAVGRVSRMEKRHFIG